MLLLRLITDYSINDIRSARWYLGKNEHAKLKY